MAGAKERGAGNEPEDVLPKTAAVAGREKAKRVSTPSGLEEVRETALLAGAAGVDVKAEQVRLLDVHELVTYTDYLVICTGRNARLTRRIAQEVSYRLKTEKGLLPVGQEGSTDGTWLLLDYLDFVVHVFTPEAREFYRLDSLWKDAPAEDVG